MKNTLLLLLATITTVFSTFQVHAPTNVKEALANTTITYSVANFGHIPFGKSMVGNLIIADPPEACNFEDLKPIKTYEMPFLLMKRGGCTFVTKVINAERLGAKLAIIEDNIIETTSYLTMKDDGNGYKVKIPSVLISDLDGKTLTEYAQKDNLVIKMQFDTDKTERVNLTLWLEANNRMSYYLVRKFGEYYEKVKDQVNLDIVHTTIPCFFCRDADCYGDNEYCAPNHDSTSTATGKHIINQQIREKVVSILYPREWWTYMDMYDQECDSLLEAEKCSAKIFEKLKLDTNKIEQSVKSNINNMSILVENKRKLDVGGIASFPGASVNSIKVPGNLKAKYLFEEVCNTLKSPPSGCKDVLENDQPVYTREESNEGWTIFFVVVAMTIILVIGFCIYKRKVTRALSAEMSSQVNDMVSKYIEFYSEREGGNKH